MQKTPVQFLSQEDPLEKGQATHSSIHGLYFEKKIFHMTWTTVILISYYFFFLFYQDMLLTQGLHICWLLSW